MNKEYNLPDFVKIKNHPQYLINKDGIIFSEKSCRVLKNQTDKKGYSVILIEGKNYKVHRLVAKSFIPNDYNKPQVNHIDGNKKNNNFSNLEWVTDSENKKHAFKYNLRKQLKGSDNPKSKMTEHYVYYARKAHCQGANIKHLASVFNVSYKLMYDIIKLNVWKHV